MIKNFNDVYETIYKNGDIELNKLKMQKNLILLVAVAVFIATIILTVKFMWYYWLIIGGIFTIFLIIKYANKQEQYRYKFKNFVIRPIVSLCSTKMSFIYKVGISLEEYNISKFNRFVNKVYSEDLIEGQATDRVYLKMSQIKAVNYTNTSKGKNEIIIFKGLFGFCDLKGHFISLINVETNMKVNELNMYRLEMDSMEFEKQYDIYAQDKIQAMQIFNPEVIELINKFKKETGYAIQLRIFKNKIFFRIPCGEAFEAPLVKGVLDYSSLYKCYKMIKLPIEIIDKIVENIEQLKS